MKTTIKRSELSEKNKEIFDKIKKAFEVDKVKAQKFLDAFEKNLAKETKPAPKKATPKKKVVAKKTTPKKATPKGKKPRVNYHAEVRKIMAEFGIKRKDALRIYKSKKKNSKGEKESISALIARFKKEFGAIKPHSSRDLKKDSEIKAKTSVKRKSPTYGKKGGAKKPFYYEYRMNRRDNSSSPAYLEKGGLLWNDIYDKYPSSKYYMSRTKLQDSSPVRLKILEKTGKKTSSGRDIYKDNPIKTYIQKDGLYFEEFAKGGTIIKKGNRVRVVNTQFDGEEGLVVSNDLHNGDYQVQMQDGKIKGFPFENLMLLSREKYAKGAEIEFAKGGYVIFADIKGEGTADVEFFDSKEEAEKRKKEYEGGKIKEVDTALGMIPVQEIKSFYIEKEKFAKGGKLNDFGIEDESVYNHIDNADLNLRSAGTKLWENKHPKSDEFTDLKMRFDNELDGDILTPREQKELGYAKGGEIEFEHGGSTDIANTILQQMGGMRRIIMFTGEKNFVALPNGVSFRIGNRSINYVKITLNGKDLYDMEFALLRGGKMTNKKEFNDIYNDQLKPIFEKATGMYLSFEKGGEIEFEHGGEMHEMDCGCMDCVEVTIDDMVFVEPQEKEKFLSGGVIIGTLAGAYVGYKIGRAKPQKKGFETEKKVASKLKKEVKKVKDSVKSKNEKRKSQNSK